MRNCLFWGFVVVLVAGLGFLLPRWMLSYRYEREYGLCTTSDLSAQLTFTQEIDLIDRLSLVKNSDVRSVGLEVTDKQAQQAHALLLEELDKLCNIGYETVPIYIEEFKHYELVNELVFIDRMNVMRVYEIRSATAFALIDQVSHKILCIGSSVAPWERASDALKSTDGEDALLVRTLQTFADYYGFTLLDVTEWEDAYFNEESRVIMSGVLSDDDGDTLDFGLAVNEFTGFCYVGEITVNTDKSSVEEGAVEGEPMWGVD